MRLSAQRIEVTPTGWAAFHRTLPVVRPHGRKLTCKCGALRSVNGHLRASRDIPTVGFDGGLLVNPDLCIADERRLPRDVAEKAINILAKSGLDIWVYVGNDWLIPHSRRSVPAARV
jgi:hypothetical protein